MLVPEVEFRKRVIACENFVIIHNNPTDLEGLVVRGSLVMIDN